VQQLGTEAHVRFVLQGGVTISGERLRVNAQLSDTQQGNRIWSEVFDFALGDPIALQDDLTARIRTSVGPRMVLAAAREAQKRPTEPRVADLLLRLQALDLHQQSAARLKESEALARQALGLDPTSTRAWQALAVSPRLQAENFAVVLGLSDAAHKGLLSQAASEAPQVLAADPGNVRMLLILAAHARDGHDVNGAQSYYEEALKLDSRYPATYNNFGVFLRDLGQSEKARELALKAVQLPTYLPPANTHVNLAVISLELGEYDDAIKWSLKAIQANPESAGARASLALGYSMEGDIQNARSSATALLQRRPDFHLPLPSGGQPWPGRESAYRDYVERSSGPLRVPQGCRSSTEGCRPQRKALPATWQPAGKWSPATIRSWPAADFDLGNPKRAATRRARDAACRHPACSRRAKKSSRS